jgi:RNA polymerase sigma-70 factor (TIGR02947 family)
MTTTLELDARFTSDALPLLDGLRRGARRLTRNEADAEDLLQETLLHAYAGFRTFKSGTNLQAWLFRILHNRWVSTHRYKQRRPTEVPVDGITEHELAASVARGTSGPRSAEAEALDAFPDNEIKAALDALPEGFRLAVYYTDVEGFTYAQTAAIMNVPLGTVMSRVARARQRLRVSLADVARRRRTPEAAERRIA